MNKNNGPYSAELAEAFRQGARWIVGDDSDDYEPILDLPDSAMIEEGPDGGVWVHVRLFVSDADRAPLHGEEHDEDDA